MARMWNKWKNGWEEREAWQYQESKSSYGWLYRVLIASVIFLSVYAVHISGTTAGGALDGAIRYVVNVDTDFDYVRQVAERYIPNTVDTSVLKRVQMTVAKPADPLLYMSKPVAGKVSMPFGWQTDPILKKEIKNEGIGIEAALGTGVHAAAPGKVKMITDSARLGKTLIIDNGNDVETVYGHLGEVLVAQDEMVSQGQVVARVGKTGIVNDPILYFEIREKGTPIDPLTRIKGDFNATERR